MKESFAGAIGRILSWRSQLEQDLDDEFDFPVEGRVDDLIEQGWTEADARPEVTRRFGRVRQVKEECRSISRRKALAAIAGAGGAGAGRNEPHRARIGRGVPSDQRGMGRQARC